MDKQSYAYILASQHYGTLYTGVTSDLIRRVWYEVHADLTSAITREKQIKQWQRDWKIKLNQSTNPAWHDLHPTLAA